ncbi:MAG: rhodanese-like domain-containing protein [Salinigranum sp.]
MSDRISRRRLLRTSAAAVALGLAGCSGQSGGGSTDQSGAGGTASGPSRADSTTSAPTTAGVNASNDANAHAAIETPIAGPKNGDTLPENSDPLDGYPPTFDRQPERRRIDTGAFDTLTVGDFEVPLVPVDVAYYWYARGEARFADARSETAYDVSHVFGAVSSPALDHEKPDPVYDWPKTDRVVAYCDCPHHLSSIRAGDLLNRGWTEVYAIDEGFGAWRERNYPLAGSDTDRTPPVRHIRGRTNKAYAGNSAWATLVGSDQKDGTRIADDGSYDIRIAFVNATGSSKVRVETPAYTAVGTIDELTGGYVTADGTITGDVPQGVDGNTTAPSGSNA